MKIKFIIPLFILCFSLSACGSKNKTPDFTKQADTTPALSVYESERDSVKFKYDPKLSYVVDHSLRYEGFERYVGFAEGEAVERGEEGYVVEFVIIPEQKESEYVNGNRYVSGFRKNGKLYYFSTSEMERYGKVVDKMADTLEFTD